MKSRVYLPFLWLSAFILLISLACGNVNPKTEQLPTPEPVKEEATKPVESPTPQPEPTQASTLVTSLEDVKKATIQIESQGSFTDPEFGELINATGRGSGFIIDPSGLAVTNNHVVTGAALLKVWVGGDTSKTYNAKILGVSECSDLALIDIDGDGFPYLEWYKDPPKISLEVFAAGYPLGDPEFTLTKGIVSKEETSGETSWASVDSVLEHDATINPGNSGGPLVTRDGKVVGVNYAGSKTTGQFFAIAEDIAVPLVDQLKTGKNVDSIGVNGQAVVSDDGSISGVWVSSVASGSPADKAGLKGGDILLKMEGLVLASDGTMSQYCDILRTHNSRDTLSVEVLRWQSQELLEGQLNGRELAVTSTLQTQPVDTPVAGNGADYPSYVQVSDDSGQIIIEVPEAWSQVNGELWSANWGNLSFEAPSITASADMDAYNNSFSESGVFFAASKRLGEIGGYIQLLDGVKGWYEDSCSLEGRYTYGEDDPLYEGKYDLWEKCGADQTAVIVLAARPKENPTAYLILLEVKISKDADFEALKHILKSFQANF